MLAKSGVPRPTQTARLAVSLQVLFRLLHRNRIVINNEAPVLCCGCNVLIYFGSRSSIVVIIMSVSIDWMSLNRSFSSGFQLFFFTQVLFTLRVLVFVSVRKWSLDNWIPCWNDSPVDMNYVQYALTELSSQLSTRTNGYDENEHRIAFPQERNNTLRIRSERHIDAFLWTKQWQIHRSAVEYTLERTLNTTASPYSVQTRTHGAIESGETTLMILALFMFLNRMDVSRCRIRRRSSPVCDSKFSVVTHRHWHHRQHLFIISKLHSHTTTASMSTD